MAQLIGKKVCLGYEGNLIVKDLDFEINKGDYLCIIGENGSGKSTLMRTILGLQNPRSGELIWGEGMTRRKIGYLPQQTVAQKDFPATVTEVVLSGCQGRMGWRPFYSAEEKELARLNMSRMEIEPLRKRCYRELSGGQQQRVLLARALCATSEMLLLDEPVSGLDPNAQAEMYRLIAKLNGEGITVIMISHDMESVYRYATHVLKIGTELFFGTAEEYRNKFGAGSGTAANNGGEVR